jgi:hypothetical protein
VHLVGFYYKYVCSIVVENVFPVKTDYTDVVQKFLGRFRPFHRPRRPLGRVEV